MGVRHERVALSNQGRTSRRTRHDGSSPRNELKVMEAAVFPQSSERIVAHLSVPGYIVAYRRRHVCHRADFQRFSGANAARVLRKDVANDWKYALHGPYAGGEQATGLRAWS